MNMVSPRGPVILAGAGNMGGALLRGWLDGGFSASDIFVQDPSPAPETALLIAQRGISLNADLKALEQTPALVVLAVKPQLMASVVPPLRHFGKVGTGYVSIAAGVELATFARLLGSGVGIVRAMPNTPASIGHGMTVACANAAISDAQKKCADVLLGAVGTVLWIDDENQMDAVTALSGSGPAYVFHLAESMAAAGQALGLGEDVALALACATVSGAGEMLRVSDESPHTLRRNVTSPGGTTAAALEILMGEDGLPSLLRAAMTAARDRSRLLKG